MYDYYFFFFYLKTQPEFHQHVWTSVCYVEYEALAGTGSIEKMKVFLYE